MRTVRDLFGFTFRDYAAPPRISMMSNTAVIEESKLAA
jgi:hypothetical protein